MTVRMFQISTEYASHIQRKQPVHHVWKGIPPPPPKKNPCKVIGQMRLMSVQKWANQMNSQSAEPAGNSAALPILSSLFLKQPPIVPPISPSKDSDWSGHLPTSGKQYGWEGFFLGAERFLTCNLSNLAALQGYYTLPTNVLLA